MISTYFTQQLYEKTGIELCIVTTEVMQREAVYQHVKTTPHRAVRDAVFMSMSFPGKTGALYWNIPCVRPYLEMTKECIPSMRISGVPKVGRDEPLAHPENNFGEILADARYTLFIKIHKIGDIFLVFPTLYSTPGYAPDEDSITVYILI